MTFFSGFGGRGKLSILNSLVQRSILAMFGNEKLSSKPWNLKHSRSVNLRIPKSSRISGTLCPPVPILAVNVGHTLFLFSLT